ncbi:competence protein ComK [Bacillus coahuilensis]|nr:competence protein ComK [Bacillus coahuilensis]
MNMIKTDQIEVKQSYVMTEDIMYLIPYKMNEQMGSLIVEQNAKYFCPLSPTKIIRQSCEYFGSDYWGRKKGTKSIIQVTHKSPIIIDNRLGIFLFPTTSPRLPECIWISEAYIHSHKVVDSKRVILHFYNGETLSLAISRYSLMNQIRRTAELKMAIIHRDSRED